jgi:predicted secreted protein
MAGEQSTFGATCSWNGNNLANLTTVGGRNTTVDTIDVTNNDSTDGWREFIAGLKNGGTLPIAGNFIPGDTDGQIALETDMAAGTIREIVIAKSGGFTFTANAICTSFKIDDMVQGTSTALTFAAEFQITGKPTFAVTTSTGLTTPFFSMSESAVIMPNPANATYEYVATVLTDITSVTVTPTAASGTITVNGNTVATGEASSAITLGSAGSVTTATIVVTETSKAPKTYVIYIARAAT